MGGQVNTEDCRRTAADAKRTPESKITPRLPKCPEKYPGFPVKMPNEAEDEFLDRIVKFWKAWRGDHLKRGVNIT